jgi:putative ABC transport system permease protein
LAIVGVVEDFHDASFHESIRPMIISHKPSWERDLGIKLASAGKGAENVKATLDAMEKVYKEVYPGKSFDYLFMDESIWEMYENEQKTASLVRMAMGRARSVYGWCWGLSGWHW